MRSILVILAAAVLVSCGGGNSDTPPVQAGMQQQRAMVSSDYTLLVQNLYVAYFGRPADPQGLAYFEQMMLRANAPGTPAELAASYGNNEQLRILIDFFGSSPESQALYPGGTQEFVNAIYANLFSRQAEAEGRDFWVRMIEAGYITRGNAALTILGAAVGSDSTTAARKAEVASDFTAALLSPAAIKGYDGMAANAVARAMLATVTGDTSRVSMQPTIQRTILSLTGGHLNLRPLASQLEQSFDPTPPVADFGRPGNHLTWFVDRNSQDALFVSVTWEMIGGLPANIWVTIGSNAAPYQYRCTDQNCPGIRIDVLAHQVTFTDAGFADPYAPTFPAPTALIANGTLTWP